MRAQEFLIVEYRNASWKIIRSLVPSHWPDYVVKDFFYQKLKNIEYLEDKKHQISLVLKEFPVRQWRLETRKLNLDSFVPKVQENLVSKMTKQDPSAAIIPRDAERHAAQAAQIQTTGQPSQEPIICFQRGDKLELLEGWHRTTQNLLAFPNGYSARVWVGYL